jgi:hypothetical protein
VRIRVVAGAGFVLLALVRHVYSFRGVVRLPHARHEEVAVGLVELEVRAPFSAPLA